jgi:hypothetical protein
MEKPCEPGDFVKVGNTVAYVDKVLPLSTHDGWTGLARDGEVPTDWNVFVWVTKPGKKRHYVGLPTTFKARTDKITVLA